MSERDWRLFLQDILYCIDKIRKYIGDMSQEEFLKDTKTQDAVVRNLEVIGEAAKNVPPEVHEKYPNIPWKQIVAMRNRFVHAYFVVDYQIVWQIAVHELPGLCCEIERILSETTDR
ncbi:MAG: hypothetical protein DRP63_00345 [Planctomycetota bacterium]|nr:MAG: hypothetical protein DRP63_00345 [Planctomycetota bacterium]